MKDNRALYKFEKLQMGALGIAIPLIIAIVVGYLLVIESAAVFPGRSQLIWFHGYQAYFVSCLWFGLAVFLFGYNFMRLYYLRRAKKTIYFAYVGITLISVGLLSSILFVLV